MKRLLLTLPLLVLLACNPLAAQPTPTPKPQTRYVIGGNNDHQSFFYLVLSECSQKPTSWAQFHAFCNAESITAVVVTPDDYGRYHQGDPYPKVN